MGRSPTIYDVAERAGVSKSLVSLVLTGSTRVSDERREAVLAAVRELNYTPSRLAAGLAGTHTRNIGVVVDDFTNLWFAPALTGIRGALQPGGYSISISDSVLNGHLGLDPLEVFRSLRVDGVILAGEVSEEAAARLGIPSVVLGTRAVRPQGVPVITSDETAGGRLATEHLIGLGHRAVVFLSAPGATALARERGYREVMNTEGLPAVVESGEATTEAAGRALVAAMLAGGARPTALIAANDRMAVGALGALHRAGLRVPEDISVVGYDNSPLADYEWVSLTTVDPDSVSVGRVAGTALVSAIEGREAAASTVLLEPHMVVRSSTAPAQ